MQDPDPAENGPDPQPGVGRYHRYLPVSATTVQRLDHGELLGYPVAVLQALDMGDVTAQRAVHGAAVGADEHPAVHRGPGRIRGTAVRAQRQRVSLLPLGKHFLTGVSYY